MTIGDRLDKAMKDAGFPSQSALARSSSVPQPTINRILKGGGAKGPETDTIKKLAAACNVSFEWLLDGSQPQGRLSVVPPSTAPKADEEDIVTADEILELAAAYRMATRKERAQILSSAKTAAKRAIRQQRAVKSD